MESNSILDRIQLFLEKRKKDYVFKTLTNSVLSFGVTVLFALYNGFLGIRLLSIWHGSICVFYLILVAIRGIILLTEKNNRTRMDKAHYRHRAFIISSAMLLMLNLALILPISLLVILEKPVNMGIIPAITMAAYTTYKMIMASVHIRKQKRNNNNNVLVTELRTVNFIDALVSILTLQNTLIMVKMEQTNTNEMLGLTAISSAAIYIVIVTITICLLIKGVKHKAVY